MNRPDDVPLATLLDLRISVNTGPNWATRDIVQALSEAGGPPFSVRHPALSGAIRRAARRLTDQISALVPDDLRLVGDVVWGPAGTDMQRLRGGALTWRERVGFAEIVASTGLWKPPDASTMPTVRIEARADRVIANRRYSELATRADAQYWAVYGVLPDGRVHLAADFATEADARRFAARWARPGTLVCSGHTEKLPHLNPRPPRAVPFARPATTSPALQRSVSSARIRR